MAFNSYENGAQFYVCADPQANDLTSTTFAALSWVRVARVGKTGKWLKTEVVSISSPTLEDQVVQKQKVVRDWGVPVVQLAYNENDDGQIVLRSQAKTAHYFAFKRVMRDGTIQYGRGVVDGPKRPDFGDDFILEIYTLSFVQEIITKT